ncbi:CDP-glycerol glycerophosphotransferase family protein [Mesobacillus zeae]|uniref:CDP-glycerol glycerophosphotransferase family protein n=1 Tax=Mesobacillus zeae TaxID=1917180 RepID=A0A398AWW4_9BACI|nr:CDP-glycerol glycerophosphotransferase family protein [Mesobacillus zeae]RID82149.1 CDP-glycerol glycerophosphotransferase family protein [Mesobacillus zeae]
MKKKIGAMLNKMILDHTVKNLFVDNRTLVIEYEGLRKISSKRYVMVKDRQSGRRLIKELSGRRASFELDELAELAENGKLDLYIFANILSKRIIKRSRFHAPLQSVQFIDEKTRCKWRVTHTKNKNLTVVSEKMLFNHHITELSTVDSNFAISGRIESFHQMVPKTAEIIIQRRDVFRRYSFKLDLKEVGASQYEFEGILYPEKLKFDLVNNSRWDLYLQLSDDNGKLLNKMLINMQSFKEFFREEDRYLETIPTEKDFVFALYATMGGNSLALWYTDSAQFARTYNIAKGKSIFNQTCEAEPVHEKIVFFESFFGKNYSGNPKYIYEHMMNNPKYKDYTFVWSYSGENTDTIPGKRIIVNRESEDYYSYLAMAKYWVSNIVFPVQRKREGNVYLQTWHGTPLKRLGFDIDIVGPETLARENFYIESRNWDYLLSANRYSSEIFKRAFKFEKEMLEVGYPLNDIFYQNDLNSKVSSIKERLGIPADKKVILYAPTWRDNEMSGSWAHSFQLKFDLERYYEKLNDDYVLLLRMHHLISDALTIDEKYKDFVYDASKYEDIQELYIASDLLITDYSSVFFDYANSRRPILFYAYDYQEYKDNVRGFYLDMEEDLPGPVIQDDIQLLDAIMNIDDIHEQYKDKYQHFTDKYNYLDDENAAKRVVDRVFK